MNSPTIKIPIGLQITILYIVIEKIHQKFRKLKKGKNSNFNHNLTLLKQSNIVTNNNFKNITKKIKATSDMKTKYIKSYVFVTGTSTLNPKTRRS